MRVIKADDRTDLYDDDKVPIVTIKTGALEIVTAEDHPVCLYAPGWWREVRP